MTEKFFVLKSALQTDVTRPVCDMAAFFGYKEAERACCILKLEPCGSAVRAVLTSGGAVWTAEAEPADGAAGGETVRCVKLAVLEVFSRLTGAEPALPWGILTGVRPGKLVHKLLDGGMAAEAVPAYLAQRYLLPPEQGGLLTEIVLRQKQLLPDAGRWSDAAVYIGVPYCPSRCSYCSFPAGIVPADEESQQNFVNLIEQDIQNVVQLLSMHSLTVRSLYIGGGTPTSLSDRAFARLLRAAGRLPAHALREFTVEAGRPDCFSEAKLAAMEAAGVKRISVNPQTFHDKTLRRIGRRHTADDFYRAYERVRRSSIPVVNMDLIIGLPGETADEIADSLRRAAALEPENLTIHTLTLKRGASLSAADMCLSAEEAAELVQLGGRTARQLGLRPYYLYRQHYMLGHLANTGYARPGTEGLYNIQMMEERHPVIGVGPAAVSKRPLADGHHLRKLHMPKNVSVYAASLQKLMRLREKLFE